VLRPSLGEWGLADVGKPFLDYGRAYCQFECDLCFRVCPTGALLPIASEDKKRSRVGRSLLSLELCIVKTKKTNCGACAEHCPSGALTMVRPSAGPGAGSLPEPVIDEDYCIGCGACETVCPSRPDKAILVEGRALHDRAKLQVRRPGDKGDVQAAAATPFTAPAGGDAVPPDAAEAPPAGGFPF
jgi:ferredoxin